MSMNVNARSAHRWGFKCYCCIESRKPSGKRREARRIKRRDRQGWKRSAVEEAATRTLAAEGIRRYYPNEYPYIIIKGE